MFNECRQLFEEYRRTLINHIITESLGPDWSNGNNTNH